MPRINDKLAHYRIEGLLKNTREESEKSVARGFLLR